MPVHPIEACYCHLIEAGLENLDRLNKADSDSDLAQNELWHLHTVNRTLTDFLLYHPHDARWTGSEHDNYWDQTRPKYMLAANPMLIDNYYIAWEFLAHATRGIEFYDEIKNEGDKHRRTLADPNAG